MAPISLGANASVPLVAWEALCAKVLLGVRESVRRLSEVLTAPICAGVSVTSSNVPLAFSLGTLMSLSAIN